MTDPKPEDATPERVVLPGGLAESIIHLGDAEDWRWDDDFDADKLSAFLDAFEVVGHEFLADPKESWYQGASFTAVVRRKADDKLFGFTYWKPISKHGETVLEANGYDFDDVEDESFVFIPVEPFPITGYQIVKAAD